MLDARLQYELDKLSRHETMIEVEKVRQIWELSTGKQPGRYGEVMIRLGQTLSAMGETLQERYGEAS